MEYINWNASGAMNSKLDRNW